MNKLLIIFLFAVSISLVSCGGKDKPKEAVIEEKKEPEEESETGTSLTAEQIKTIGVQLGMIEQKQLTASLKTNGVLKVPNQNKASINSVYSGVIRSLLVQPGNTVTKGQTIATIANPEFIQVQSEYIGIDSKMVLAEQEYNRQKELNAGNAGALKNLQSAEAELKSLRSRKATLQQQVQLMGIDPSNLSSGKLISVLSIKSPISGIVSNVLVKMGSYVDLTTVVAEVVDNSQLHLDLFVYEKDLSKLKNNQTIHFTITNDPGKEYDAKIFSLGSSFENESKAVSVHAMVSGNKTGLIDGMNVTANISLDKQVMPAIPSEAIVSYQGKDIIFMVDSVDNKTGDTYFKIIPVAKGTSDIGYTEITLLNDIPLGTKVVTKGSFFILAKMTNKSED
ncbi:MAG: efflux RND transporter periplasmic adaptor subunit [Chitinophagaceae bacterium]|nr:MAG: efflux RND transporter periplasmic adaptor subunit [Chitinophagaceae bacterium]